MKAIGIIPARYASTRFPGKPLIDIGGKSMIQRVYEQASSCNALSGVFVATDDQRIFDHVKDFGGKIVMTAANHKSGTDRCQEAVKNSSIELTDPDVIVNIQGDEPFLDPKQIELLLRSFENAKTQIATLIKKIDRPEDLFNPNIVKVVIDKKGQAVYFSRQAIPFFRESEEKDWIKNHSYFKHIGVYAYRTEVLDQITKIEPSTLELAENLEQLRWIENDYKIQTQMTITENMAIDTPEDLKKLGF